MKKLIKKPETILALMFFIPFALALIINSIPRQIFFYSPTCPSCTAEIKAEVYKEYPNAFWADVTDQSALELAHKYNVKYIPAVVDIISGEKLMEANN